MEQRWELHFNPTPTLAVAMCRHTTPKEADTRKRSGRKPGRKKRQARGGKDGAERKKKEKEGGRGIKKDMPQ